LHLGFGQAGDMPSVIVFELKVAICHPTKEREGLSAAQEAKTLSKGETIASPGVV
jgi:hypothetical protein